MLRVESHMNIVHIADKQLIGANEGSRNDKSRDIEDSQADSV